MEMAYIQAENLKHKRTFTKTLMILAPFVTALMNFFAPLWFQLNSYNWWYILLYPGFLTLTCALVEQRDNGRLKSVNISSATRIGSSAFRNCAVLSSIAMGGALSDIGDYAFADNPGLVNVTIPGGTKRVGEYAFKNDNNLRNVSVADGVTEIDDGAFENCSALAAIVLPYSVTVIGSYAFKNCTALTRAVIDNCVTRIGTEAFYNDTALSSLSLGTALNTIGREAFRYCNSLSRVLIPNSVLTIEDDAFRDCQSLELVKIGYAIKTIGDGAFRDCGSLKTAYVYGKLAEFERRAFPSGSNLLIYGFEDSTAKSLAADNDNRFSAVTQSSLNASDFALERTVYTWTGKFILPKVKNSKNLVEGIDYDVVYDYEKYAGTHKVSIYPCNSYKASNIQGYFDLPYSVVKGIQIIGNVSDRKVDYGSKSFRIGATLLAGDGTLTYSSSKPKVASVNKATGAVSIKGIGTTTITVTAGATRNCSAVKKQMKITVKKGTQTIRKVKSSYTKKKTAKSFTLKAKAKGKVSYSSTKKNVVSVNSEGKVTIRKKGTAYIIVKAKGTKTYKPAKKKIKIVIK